MRQKKQPHRGFTLVELLIVIAIISILAVMAILYLNPVELLRQSRDSSRLSDLSTLTNALALYLSDVQEVSLGTAGVCYMGNSIGTSTAGCLAYFPTATSTATSTSRSLDGTGWVPVNFTKVSSGLPIDSLPVDPSGVNSPDYFYSYIVGANSTYKMAARIESILYGAGGARDAVSKDGGVSASTFEIGSALDL